ncbi:MAG: DUF1501 domain-containing protein [Planctomycetia bacterium]|nr:DUF1501 domain-containing protein [Planctomycetia bacterium]
MLTFWGAKHSYCDRINRRDFLHIGGLGLGGLALPELLRARAQAGVKSGPRAVIMICLAGGPSHMDMYDLKPGAPEDYRGEFKPIHTNVPGFEICEHMPLQAQIADKLAVVRSLQWVEPMQHELEEVYTGFPQAGKRPCFGSVISRFGKGHDPRLPRFVSLQPTDAESPMYVGPAHAALPVPYVNTATRNLVLPQRMTLDRLDDRKKLMATFDDLRRDLDARGSMHATDTFTAQALEMITSPKAREAFDIYREPDKVRQRYGDKDAKYSYVSQKLDSPWPTEKFLLARRLVEAGVSVVTMRVGSWDQHGNVIQASGGKNIFYNLSTALPLLDRSLYALVTDLHERGLDKEVLVLVWGEFGRTPKISQGGRDHWPDAGFALFAGGGLKMGQVIGETDSKGARPKNRPLGPQNVLSTIYHALGIDPAQTLPDFTGRPQYLLDEREPITELL